MAERGTPADFVPPRTMRGVWLTGHGGLDRLEFRSDIPVPRPGGRDVLVQVAAAALNNTDVNTRTGWYSKRGGAGEDAGWDGAPVGFPRIQGIDVCGRIVAVGAEVDPARVGQRVLIEPCLREAGGATLDRPMFLGSDCDGGFAEYVVVASRHAWRVDSPLSDAELSSFPCAYSTAENMLARTGVSAGDRVVVTGASGGVGSAAVQLARARGARVFALARASKAAGVVELGAERTFGSHAEMTVGLGRDSVDAVVDLVAGPQWPALLDVLRPGGRYAVAGAVAGAMVELDLRTLYLKDLSLFGCTVLGPQVFADLVRRIERGEAVPVVARAFALEDIAVAQAEFMARKHVGKIVLNVAARR